MTVQLGRTRKLHDLRRGDIINMRVPFEENTRDYYNGYKPEEIRGRPFTDRFGQSGKERMVIYMGRMGQTMLYLPLTSKQHDADERYEQYELKDNSMTPKKDPTRKSYVETHTLRSMKINRNRNLDYTGRLNKLDLGNIIHRIANNTLQLDSNRDQRGYIPNTMREVFLMELIHQGFCDWRQTPYGDVYRKKDQSSSVTLTQFGMVHYHVNVTKEEVHEMISKREGRPLPPLKDSSLDFQQQVQQLTNGKETKQYATTH